MSRSANPAAARSSRLGSRPLTGDATTDAGGRWQAVWSGTVAAIFFSRFFLPAESAAQGDTLWIAGLWMLAGLVWMAGVWRGAFPRIRFDWLDVAVCVWIGGQMISVLIVVLTAAGDKRAAANLGWEWIAIGIVWLVFRHGITGCSRRTAILRAMIVTGTVLGGYGLYQHYVSHPQLVAEYGPLFDRLRSAGGSEAATIKQKLAREGIPTDGPALVLFEKRMRDSREPMGLFALANTFGGCLTVCLLLALGEVLAARRRGAGWKSLVPLIGAAVLMGWCLLLTKSRTAWIGSACGLLVLAAPWAVQLVGSWAGSRAGPEVESPGNRRGLLLPLGLSFAAIVGMTTLLLAVGGLDRQVLSEAPKSLAYRIQYWQATSRLIADHWWLGVGPGNFRQHYLQYKLPEASEEIADPHNLFFEVAATGGIFSAVGLTLFLGLAFVRAWRSLCTGERAGDRSPTAATTDSRAGPPETLTFWMAGAGAVLAFTGPFACFGDWEDRVLVLAAVWFALAAVIGRRWAASFSNEHFRGSPAAVAAAVALTVHLLGAGGIGMPGVSQVLIALVAISLPPNSLLKHVAWTPRPSEIQLKTDGRGVHPTVFQQAPKGEPTTGVGSARSIGSLVAAVGFVVVLVGLTTTALLPVLNCRRLLRQGLEAGWTAGAHGRPTTTVAFLRRAAAADPWSVEPWRNQFEFEWSAGGGFQSNESFQTAVEHLLEVRNRDPVNFWAPRTLGTIWFQKWQATHKLEDARQAVAWLRRACDSYPTNAAIRAELAVALESAGERTDAVHAAQSALKQDDIYHQQGHVDRYLDASIRQRLETMAAE